MTDKTLPLTEYPVPALLLRANAVPPDPPEAPLQKLYLDLEGNVCLMDSTGKVRVLVFWK